VVLDERIKNFFFGTLKFYLSLCQSNGGGGGLSESEERLLVVAAAQEMEGRNEL
tara:strand:+ start:134 stop:295 length:162 start_codon:yes stop_codon:yes gene_type:complete